MTIPSSLFRVLAALSLFAAATGTQAAEPTPNSDAAKTKLVLEKGIDGDAILKSYGTPYEIKPMESPDKNTKVERWIYRRKVKETTVQTASNQTLVPVYSGFGGSGEQSIREVVVPEYRLMHVTVFQVTELLMINGKLEIAKQWMGREEKYD